MTFDEFVRAELPALHRYAAVLTADPDRAEDVVADALVKAHSRWRRIGRMQYPAAYVRRIVTSTFLSAERLWARRHIRPTRTGELPERETADATGTVDDRDQLACLLAGLPHRQRVVIVMRFYLGLSNPEITAELGITPGAVSTAASRALRKLRIAIDDETAESAPHEESGTVADAASHLASPDAAILADRYDEHDAILASALSMNRNPRVGSPS